MCATRIRVGVSKVRLIAEHPRFHLHPRAVLLWRLLANQDTTGFVRPEAQNSLNTNSVINPYVGNPAPVPDWTQQAMFVAAHAQADMIREHMRQGLIESDLDPDQYPLPLS